LIYHTVTGTEITPSKAGQIARTGSLTTRAHRRRRQIPLTPPFSSKQNTTIK
ncbi:hypothetical protein PoMZ_08014, partial [Pyricularia oryzae]